MNNATKTKKQLIDGLTALRKRAAEGDASKDKSESHDHISLRSDEIFRYFVENANDIVFSLTPAGILTYVSPNWTEILGHDVHKVIGQPIESFVHPEDVPLCRAFIERVIVTGKKQAGVEYRIRHQTGAWRWHTTNASPVRDAGGNIVSYMGIARDITDRKQTEEALRSSEEKFRALSESSTAAVFLIQGTKYIYVNPAFERMTGYTMDDLANMNFWDFMHPDSRELVRNRGLLRLKGESQQPSYEIKFTTKSGEDRWADFAATLITLDNKPTIMGSTFDITERKRAEEALKRTNAFLDSIIENVPNMIFLKEARTLRFVRFNKAGEDLLGYSRNDLLGKNDYDFFPKEQADFFTEKDREVLRGKALEDILEESIQTRNKGERTLHTKKVPILNADREPEFLLGISEDITERKQAEKTLQRQNVYLESLNETALGLMRRTDLTDLFQAIVVRAMHFFGTDEAWICIYDSQKGEFEYRAAVGQREDKIGARFVSGYGITGEVLRTEQTVLLDDYHVWPKRASGSEYDMRRATVAIPLRYEERLAGILGLSHHDSAKRFEDDEVAMLERLAELASIALDNARLYDRIKLELAERKQAEEENIRLAERLQRAEKMEALGTLAGGVAHDLNNVLGIVVGYAELLLNEVDKSSPIRPRLLNIVSGGEKAAAIVQDLLTLARRGVPSRQILNLNKIIVDDQHSPEFKMLFSQHPAIQIKTHLEPDLLNISGSPVHMSKTLFNLVSNASEAMPNGGVLTISTANQYIDKPIHGYDEVRQGDYVVLSVSDTGDGIPPADLKRIFEPFYTKKVMGRSGTGLGLSVVWGTVKDHQGYVNVQSDEGKGSTFTLYIPVTRGEITAERAAANISEYMGRGEAILVVDDVEGQRDLAVEMLRNLNYRVTSVSSGEAAVAYIKEHHIDLLVLDMIMDPGMDGLDTYRSVLEIRPKQKAIIVSGFSETDRVSRAQAIGAGAYVRKPYILERLGLAVRKELDRSI